MHLFLCGDVMLGRAVDQIMLHKNNPTLYESYVTNAVYYVPDQMIKYTKLDAHVEPTYVWGDLLAEPLFVSASSKIINLETSITTSNHPTDKLVLYKMHPKNITVIQAASIDYCNMANNHVMDWGEQGLVETIETLNSAQINYGGIGMNIDAAIEPVTINNNIAIFSYADVDSGTPFDWIAGKSKPGVNVIDTTNSITKYVVADHINQFRAKNKFSQIIVSIHWGSNWGFEIEPNHEEFAHYLIDNAGVDVIHGHSSHHIRPIEIYHNKLILYGCGDLINDYETINNPGQKYFMPEVSVAYFPVYDNQRVLTKVIIVPYTLHNIRLEQIPVSEHNKIIDLLNKISRPYNTLFIADGTHIVCYAHNANRSKYLHKYIKYKTKYTHLLNTIN